MTAPVAAPAPDRFLRHQLPWLIVLLQLAWWSYAAWPIVPVEGDEQRVLLGVEGLLQRDTFLTHLRYSYSVQPGVYPVLATLATLSGLSAQTVFGFATMAGAVGFAGIGARFLQLVSGWPLGWLLVVLLWCQEITTAGCYMNTSALAGGPAMLAVLLSGRTSRGAWLWPGLLLAVAGWLRADSLLIAPACLGFTYWQWRAWRPAILRTTAIAGVTVTGLALLFWLSGTSVGGGVSAFEQRGFFFTSWRALAESPVQVFSPALALAGLVGLGLILRQKHYALGLLVLWGTLPTLLAHGPAYTTPKYLYYLVPFALIPVLVAIGHAWQAAVRVAPRPVVVGGMALVALADGLVGLRTLQPEQRLFVAEPTWCSLGRLPSTRKPLELVIGPGELLINVDAFRLRTGQLFAPWCWHREKMRMQADLALIASWLREKPTVTIYWSDAMPHDVLLGQLTALGYRPPADSMLHADTAVQEDWRRDGQVAHVNFLGYADSPFQPPGPAPASTTGPDTYFLGCWARRTITPLADGRTWQLLSAAPEGLLSLHQRR